MKTLLRISALAGLSLGAAVFALAQKPNEPSEVVRRIQQFQELKAGDKLVFSCNQCKETTEHTVASHEEAMELCKEGATVNCPACKMTFKVVLTGQPKDPKPTREVKYVNDKGEECLFIARKVPAHAEHQH